MAATVDGIDALRSRMAELAVNGVDRASRKGLRAGVRELAAAQKAAAPVGTPGRKNRRGEPIKPGGLRRAIRSRVVTQTKGHGRGITRAKAGMNVGLRPDDRRRAPHGHLVAKGTKKRQTKTGQNRGTMPANDFIRKASASAASRAVQTMQRVTAEELRKEIARP
jgi:HK97 gp10 family phage protein